MSVVAGGVGGGATGLLLGAAAEQMVADQGRRTEMRYCDSTWAEWAAFCDAPAPGPWATMYTELQHPAGMDRLLLTYAADDGGEHGQAVRYSLTGDGKELECALLLPTGPGAESGASSWCTFRLALPEVVQAELARGGRLRAPDLRQSRGGTWVLDLKVEALPKGARPGVPERMQSFSWAWMAGAGAATTGAAIGDLGPEAPGDEILEEPGESFGKRIVAVLAAGAFESGNNQLQQLLDRSTGVFYHFRGGGPSSNRAPPSQPLRNESLNVGRQVLDGTCTSATRELSELYHQRNATVHRAIGVASLGEPRGVAFDLWTEPEGADSINRLGLDEVPLQHRITASPLQGEEASPVASMIIMFHLTRAIGRQPAPAEGCRGPPGHNAGGHIIGDTSSGRPRADPRSPTGDRAASALWPRRTPCPTKVR